LPCPHPCPDLALTALTITFTLATITTLATALVPSPLRPCLPLPMSALTTIAVAINNERRRHRPLTVRQQQ
jgi:hypothetical protein